MEAIYNNFFYKIKIKGVKLANLKVFISSTCYDLSIIREQLKKFIENMGYFTILSDYSDILYDPREHTHTSCVQEVKNADMVILIIGSRYGGKTVPDALKEIDLDKLKELSTSPQLISESKELSITQLEILKAIELDIPLYIFVDSKVSHEHYVYSKNKEIKGMIFPSIDKQESAKYIFSFIDFLQHRVRNNNLMKYTKFEDIEYQLKNQWSAYFQRLLKEQRKDDQECKSFSSISEQINDLKIALISTISDTQAKDIARGTIEFRRLIDCLISLNIDKNDILSENKTILDLLKSINIKYFVEIENDIYGRSNFILIKEDKSIILSRIRIRFFSDMIQDYEKFKSLQSDFRKVIYDTLSDIYSNRGMMIFKSQPIKIKDYLKDNFQKDKIIEILNSKKEIDYINKF